MQAPWRAQASSSHIYERRLGTTELASYWDGQFNGTADALHHAYFEVKNGDPNVVLSRSRISKIWRLLKHQFPLLGCRAERRSDTDIFFVVDEQALREVSSSELEYKPAGSAEEVIDIMDRIVAGPRLLSDALQARIFVFPRTDQPRQCHIIFHLAHCITDGFSGILLSRTFLEYLRSPLGEPLNLRTRLSLTLPSEDLFPSASLSQARRRWIRAISLIINSNQLARSPGGHTLPRRVTSTTPFTHGHPGFMSSMFSVEDSQRVIRNCKRLRVTFGNVYPVLGQVALVRVLLRRYLNGEIDEEEWEYRKREPMGMSCPVNLRPYYNREWQRKGGAHNVSLFVGFFLLILPFMPLGEAQDIRPGVPLPTFSQLLTPSRFLLRSRSVKQQMANVIQNPLGLDVLNAGLPGHIQTLREVVRVANQTPKMTRDLTLLTPMEQSRKGFVIISGGSSVGNVDALLPPEYGSENGVKIAFHPSATRLRCRPMELYLVTTTFRDKLQMYVFFDKDVYDQEVVEEWLEEIRAATLHYLGEDIAKL
ncbi:hypothetical protein BDN72DRAFT_755683 [Pluteus cervinus]|uniref:Uncharacterized protein n=1 Tax=Pluteus cervinus TaxID=181527 RepID=A0ACD3BF53_9AGAR|nr:hypothetical protein BDN72DRAFT_755683 [Pluteus cervinus]